MKTISKNPVAPESKPNAEAKGKDDLKSLPMAELQKKLESSPDGLTREEAKKRLTQYGPNEIEEKKTNMFLKFLSYFCQDIVGSRSWYANHCNLHSSLWPVYDTIRLGMGIVCLGLCIGLVPL